MVSLCVAMRKEPVLVHHAALYGIVSESVPDSVDSGFEFFHGFLLFSRIVKGYLARLCVWS